MISTPAQAAPIPGLRPWQLVWLAAAVFVISAGYGALLPQWQGWMSILNPGTTATAVSRHIGFLSGMYTAGVLVGAPLWGMLADRVGRGRVLIFGLVGYVTSLLVMMIPRFETLWGIYALRAATGFFVAAVVPVVSALVAEHTPEFQRARRFAWLGAMSLLGFLFGPALNIVARLAGPWVEGGESSAELTAKAVIVLSAIFGAIMMLGLARTLPERIVIAAAQCKSGNQPRQVMQRPFGSAGQSPSCCLPLSWASCFRANPMQACRRAKSQ